MFYEKQKRTMASSFNRFMPRAVTAMMRKSAAKGVFSSFDPKKNDDLFKSYASMEEGGVSSKLHQWNHPHKPKKKDGWETEDVIGITTLGLICALCMWALIFVFRSTRGLFFPTTVAMYTPTDEEQKMAEDIMTLYMNHDEAAAHEKAYNYMKSDCLDHFPFSLSQESQTTLHAHIMDLVNYITHVGPVSGLTEGHIVVGQDGALYSMDEEDTVQQTHATCGLVNALLWYSHHKAHVVHPDTNVHMHDMHETYTDYTAHHKSDINGDIYHDAKLLLEKARSDPYSFDIDAEAALMAHCSHLPQLHSEASWHLYSEIGNHFYLLVSSTYHQQGFKAPKTVITAEGEVKVMEQIDAIKTNHETCDLLDVAYHYHSNTIDEAFEKAMTSIDNYDYGATDLIVNALVDDYCPEAAQRLDPYSVHNVAGIVMELLSDIKHKVHVNIGKNEDLVITEYGNVIPRNMAKDHGLSNHDVFTCNLLNELAKKLRTNEKEIDDHVFIEMEEEQKSFETETKHMKEEHARHPLHDIRTLITLASNNHLGNFEMHLWNALNSYHEVEFKDMTQEAQDVLHYQVSSAIGIIVAQGDHVDLGEELSFSKITGDLYYWDEASAKEHQLVRSPLLAAMSKTHTFHNDQDVKKFIDTSEVKEVTDHVVQLIHYQRDEEHALLHDALHQHINTHCPTISKGEFTEDRRNIETSMEWIISYAAGTHYFNGDFNIILKDQHVHTVFGDIPTGVTQCVLFDEIARFARISNNAAESQAEKDEDDKFIREQFNDEVTTTVHYNLAKDIDLLVASASAKHQNLRQLDADIHSHLEYYCSNIIRSLDMSSNHHLHSTLMDTIINIATHGSTYRNPSGEHVIMEDGSIMLKSHTQKNERTYTCNFIDRIYEKL